MTDAERQLLFDTARTVIRLSEQVHLKLDGMQSVLRALYLANGNAQLAIARLRIERDLRHMRGEKSDYLSQFIESIDKGGGE